MVKIFSDVFSYRYTFELRNIKFPSFGTRSEMLGRLSDSFTLRRRGQTRWLDSPLTDGCGYTHTAVFDRPLFLIHSTLGMVPKIVPLEIIIGAVIAWCLYTGDVERSFQSAHLMVGKVFSEVCFGLLGSGNVNLLPNTIRNTGWLRMS